MVFRYEIRQISKIVWHLQFIIPLFLLLIGAFIYWQVLFVILLVLLFYIFHTFTQFDSVYVDNKNNMVFKREIFCLKKVVSFPFDSLLVIEHVQVWVYFVFETKRIKMLLNKDLLKKEANLLFRVLIEERRKEAEFNEIRIRGF